ncbi:hypothetical protein TraAM80_05266 [Trypanosoma rangeli]|uniref:Uncharacterized protein n=1 Tax=Trypanosoma rangeli TaxID=5698 RepID=A0A422NFI8_TRYRA|nr:uncharacterized protein TraAM80_05266 [Trypanosoma rangeli]RNF04207.1 hypothetical protein TraAM80_05266 [Trypanosoma rangeli]|eukprot:RNF04207.1 hypothetical protein TraAM80_05266 [Trypanosoma rangeli]
MCMPQSCRTTDSSHHSCPYARISTTTAVSASEDLKEKPSWSERQRAALGRASGAVATVPERKGSTMLARPLSDLRSKSRQSCLESLHLGFHKLAHVSVKSEEGQGFFLKDSCFRFCF